jgi:drug/metabolite transporter (DMT)-like permease
MESWLVFALLYPAVLACVNVLDKFLLEKRIRDYRCLCLLVGFLALVAGVVLTTSAPWTALPTDKIVLGFAAGLLIALTYPLYFSVLSFEEVSRTVSIIYATPVLVSFFAAVALGESLPIWKYAAVVFAAAGAVLIGIDRFRKTPVMRRGFWRLVAMCVIIGVVNIMGKYALAELSIWNYIGLELLGMTSLLLFAFSRHARRHIAHSLKSMHLIALSEYSTYGAWLLWAAGTSVASASLMSAMGSLQPLYVLALMLLLSAFKPRILKEVFTKKTLALKAVAVLMIVIGTFFVAL